MDMKQYRKHLQQHLKESAASADAAKLSQRLDEFERAAKNLLVAWEDAGDSAGDDILQPDGYPFQESFDEVVENFSKFTRSFKAKLRTIK